MNTHEELAYKVGYLYARYLVKNGLKLTPEVINKLQEKMPSPLFPDEREIIWMLECEEMLKKK